MLLTRAIRGLLACGAATLSGLLRQWVDGPPAGPPDEPKADGALAQKTLVVVVDELNAQTLSADHSQTVRFALDGQSYEIDLSDQNAAELRQAFQPYVQSGRRISRRTRTATSPRDRAPNRRGTQAGRREENAAIREWARAHGHEITDRGRIPGIVVQAYQASD